MSVGLELPLGKYLDSRACPRVWPMPLTLGFSARLLSPGADGLTLEPW